MGRCALVYIPLLFRTFHGKYLAAVPAWLRGDSNAGYPLKSLKEAGHSVQELKDTRWISTTVAPQVKGRRQVSCMKGRWQYPELIPRGIPEFRGFPERQRWEQLWNGLFTMKTQGPMCPSFLVSPIIATMPMGEKLRGFCSDMNNFVLEGLVAMYTGIPLSICSPSGERDLWAETFADPGLHRCYSCTLPNKEKITSPAAWAAGAKTSVYEAAAGGYRAEGLVDMKRFLYQKLFVLRPEIQARLDRLQADLGLSHEPYVGIHIRRGDKRKESGISRSTADFAVEAERLCEANGAKKVFLASDDASEFKKLRAVISSDIEVVTQTRQSNTTYAERGALESTAEQVLINDIFLLIRAAAFVGTASSNLDRFVWFLRDPATQSISLDDGGDFLYRNC